MYKDGRTYFGDKNCWFENYSCNSIQCLINQDFPRYKCSTDPSGEISSQEYGIGKFYVKVAGDVSRIYRLESCMLFDEVRIERGIWLNPTNFGETLDKLKLWVIFS
jgi:hypothetical protein